MMKADRPRVLAVDDERANLDTFRRVFRRDFDVTVAESGNEGLRVLEREPFAVVFADYTMPEMNGVDFLREVRRRWPHVLRIMLTGYVDLPEIDAARANGICHQVLVKPYSPQEIRDCVRHHVQGA